MTALSHRSLVWVGPNSNIDIHDDFMSLFARQVVVEGDFFAGFDTASNVQKLRRRLAASRGIYGGSLDNLNSFLTAKNAIERACRRE